MFLGGWYGFGLFFGVNKRDLYRYVNYLPHENREVKKMDSQLAN